MPKASSDPESKWVTQTRLSEILGRSKPLINIWRKTYDDFPGPHKETQRYNLDAVMAWLKAHPECQPNVKTASAAGRESLLCEQLEKKNKLLDLQIEEEEGELVKVDSVLAMFAKERAANVEAFKKRLLSEVPAESEGKQAREIAEILQEAFDKYLEDLNESIPKIVAEIEN